jgi:hypothetical protein
MTVRRYEFIVIVTNMKILHIYFYLLFGLITLNIQSYLYADEVVLPDTQIVLNKNLILNGSGLRKVTIFGIRVYVLGLYLEDKSSNPEYIIDSKENKKILIKFLRSVSKERLVDGLVESIEDNYPNWKNINSQIEILNENITDVEEGDVLEFEFFDENVKFTLNGNRSITIINQELVTALLSIWLGPDPAGEDLKNAILGISYED